MKYIIELTPQELSETIFALDTHAEWVETNLPNSEKRVSDIRKMETKLFKILGTEPLRNRRLP